MRHCLLSAALSLLALGACSPAPAYEYPESLRTQFARSCPLEDATCACSWDKITRVMEATEFEAAMTRYREEGLMDPRLTKARAECVGA